MPMKRQIGGAASGAAKKAGGCSCLERITTPELRGLRELIKSHTPLLSITGMPDFRGTTTGKRQKTASQSILNIEIGNLLGEGGSGDVYKCVVDLRYEDSVDRHIIHAIGALKIEESPGCKEGTILNQLLDEPYIKMIHGIFLHEYNNICYYLLEYADYDFRSFASEVRKNQFLTDSTVKAEYAKKVVVDLLEQVMAIQLHNHDYIYTDFKPANVLCRDIPCTSECLANCQLHPPSVHMGDIGGANYHHSGSRIINVSTYPVPEETGKTGYVLKRQKRSPIPNRRILSHFAYGLGIIVLSLYVHIPSELQFVHSDRETYVTSTLSQAGVPDEIVRLLSRNPDDRCQSLIGMCKGSPEAIKPKHFGGPPLIHDTVLSGKSLGTYLEGWIWKVGYKSLN